MEKSKSIKIIKISVFAILCAFAVFLIYSVVGYLLWWFEQPRFVSTSGLVTSSWGFLIQFIIFSGVLLLVLAAIITLAILFFSKKSKYKI